MLKRRALVMFLVVLMLALPVVAAAASAVEFEDDNLAAAVIAEFENLGRVRERSNIAQADMKLLNKIYANGDYVNDTNELAQPPYGADKDEVIRDLTGLEYALKLDALDVSKNFIKDLAPIRNLPLSFLDIQGNADPDAVPNYVPGFSLNPSSPQMRILQEIQHRGAVVWHDGLVSRISGPDRYQTAIRIWQNMYTLGFEENNDAKGDNSKASLGGMTYAPGNTIVLARGDDFADALVGAPLAYALGETIPVSDEVDFTFPAPILLTTSNKLHPATKAALVNYIEKFEDDLTGADFNGVFDVVVLGGTAAISDAVVNELIYAIETEFDALDVRAIRIGGADRYATSVAIAKKLAEVREDEAYAADEELVFASGEDFPDALAAAPYAAVDNVPILLTKGGDLPACVVDYLKDLGKGNLKQGNTFDAVVAGGAAAVSEKVIDQLINLKYRDAGENENVFDTVTRVWGADRYATSVQLGKHYKAINGKIGADFYIATGENFADALTGAPLAAMWGTGILLVKQDAIPGSVEKVINFQNNTDPDVSTNLCILGGEAAVSLYNAVKMYNLVRYPAWAPR